MPHRILLYIAPLAFSLAACASDPHAAPELPVEPPVEPAPGPAPQLPPASTPVLVTLATPDGSGQTVHPDVVTLPPSWQTPGRLLAITPYPHGDANEENPSVFVERSSREWLAPAGLVNPVVRPANGYLSDPDIVAVPEHNELWVYYRSVTRTNDIELIRTSDGVHFSAPRLVASAPNHDLVSPAVVHRAPNDWLMWSVKSGEGCAGASTALELRRSTNGLDWSAPEHVALSQPGVFAWHIDVQWIPSRNEFWAVYNGKVAGSCTTAALFIATSADGLTWTTFPAPILTRGVIDAFQDIVYRSAFAFDATNDAIDFWYSGATYAHGAYDWRTAYARRARAEVFEAASRRNAAIVLGPRAHSPPLIDPP